MRGAGASVSNASACRMKMSSHWGHVDMASAYSRSYGGTPMRPAVRRDSCCARRSSSCSIAISGVGQMSCCTSRAKRRTRESNGATFLDPRHRYRRRRPSSVDDVRTIEGQLLGTVEQRVDRLDALREAVILVRHLVLPGAESTAAQDVALSQLRLNDRQAAIAFQ